MNENFKIFILEDMPEEKLLSNQDQIYFSVMSSEYRLKQTLKEQWNHKVP